MTRCVEAAWVPPSFWFKRRHPTRATAESGRPDSNRRRPAWEAVGLCLSKAGEGTRTLDIHVGNVTLYH